jgi:hypothetical protein
MDFIIQDLNDRKIEINEYLKLIEFLDGNDFIIGNDSENFRVTSLLKKTIKGSVYLILYSLVESTMRDAVIAIHENITISSSTFDDLREELQCKILSRAKREKISIPILIDGARDDISLNIHQATLNSKDLFSGNVNRDEIKEVARTYGFSSSTDYSSTGHGAQLNVVKKNRNDLSHGNKTFSGVGGEISIEELRVFSNKVISYMEEISDNIVDSLEQKLYLKS